MSKILQLYKFKKFVLIIFFLVFNITCATNTKKTDFPQEEVQKALSSGTTVLFYFYADSIPNSLKIKQTIDNLKLQLKDNIKVFSINADQYSDFAYLYEVSYVPDLLIIKPQKSITNRFTLEIDEKALKNAIKGNEILKNTKKIEKKLKEGKPLILFFYTDWCFYCRKLIPIIKEFESEFSNKVGIIWINIDEDYKMADIFGVPGVPVITIINKHGLVVERFGGYGATKEKIIRAFENIGIKMR